MVVQREKLTSIRTSPLVVVTAMRVVVIVVSKTSIIHLRFLEFL